MEAETNESFLELFLSLQSDFTLRIVIFLITFWIRLELKLLNRQLRGVSRLQLAFNSSSDSGKT